MGDLRVRTDEFYRAGWKRAMLHGALPDPRTAPSPSGEWSPDWIAFVEHGEEAQPDDVWILRQPPGDPCRRNYREDHLDWPIVGYALTCPQPACATGVHAWDHAHECKACPGGCQKGPDRGCWDWSGSAYDNTLTANPSLHCVLELGGCGWHGWLRNGEMVG